MNSAVTTRILRSALVLYSDEAMFALVNDVASYPRYMDGCFETEVFSASDTEMHARLDLKRGPVTTSFTTRNLLVKPSRIEMQLEKGPFKKLYGLWEFKSLTVSACKVSLDLEFEFSNASMGIAASGLFTSVADQLVDAVCRRADQIYGKSQ